MFEKRKQIEQKSEQKTNRKSLEEMKYSMLQLERTTIHFSFKALVLTTWFVPLKNREGLARNIPRTSGSLSLPITLFSRERISLKIGPGPGLLQSGSCYIRRDRPANHFSAQRCAAREASVMRNPTTLCNNVGVGHAVGGPGDRRKNPRDRDKKINVAVDQCSRGASRNVIEAALFSLRMRPPFQYFI